MGPGTGHEPLPELEFHRLHKAGCYHPAAFQGGLPMARSSRLFAVATVAMVVSAPVSAALFTVTLANGTTFASRYQPRDAEFDSQKIVFLDEMGLLVSLPKSDVVSVESDMDQKGFGHMLDDTTMAFGWAPNDRGEVDPNEAIASSDVGSGEAAEPIYNVNETPAMPLYITIPNEVGPAPVAAPAPVVPPPGQ